MSYFFIFMISYLFTYYVLTNFSPLSSNPMEKTKLDSIEKTMEQDYLLNSKYPTSRLEPGKFAGHYDYTEYFTENDEGLWEVNLFLPNSFHEKMDNNNFRKTFESFFPSFRLIRKITELSASYDAKNYAMILDSDTLSEQFTSNTSILELASNYYRNVFSQDFMKEIYDESFTKELKKQVKEAVKKDTENGTMNKAMLEDPLTSIIYKKEFTKKKSKHESRRQAILDNQEALIALLAKEEPGLNKISAEEFETVFENHSELNKNLND